MRRLVVVLSLVVAALVAAAGLLSAAGTRTTLGADFARVMGGREIATVCEGQSYVPSADASVAICKIDRPAFLTGVDLDVGRSGGSGQTRCYVQVNETTVPSSTVTVAAASGAHRSGSVTLRRPLESGDRIHVRIGEVTSGSNSLQIWCRARVVERF